MSAKNTITVFPYATISKVAPKQENSMTENIWNGYREYDVGIGTFGPRPSPTQKFKIRYSHSYEKSNRNTLCDTMHLFLCEECSCRLCTCRGNRDDLHPRL